MHSVKWYPPLYSLKWMSPLANSGNRIVEMKHTIQEIWVYNYKRYNRKGNPYLVINSTTRMQSDNKDELCVGVALCSYWSPYNCPRNHQNCKNKIKYICTANRLKGNCKFPGKTSTFQCNLVQISTALLNWIFYEYKSLLASWERNLENFK